MSKTTVVFFHISSGSYGGGSQMLYRLLSSIDTESIEPILLAQRDDALTRKLRDEGIPVCIVPFRGSLDTYNQGLLTGTVRTKVSSGFRLFQFNVEARDVLRRADVIWCKNLRAVLTIAPYALLSDSRVLWNIGLGRPSEGIIEHLNSVAIRIVDEILIESRVQADRIFTDTQLRNADGKLTIISKGIDVDQFAPELDDGSDEFVVGMAALITPRKRVEDFVEAAALVREERPDVQFMVAGTPPDEADAEYMSRLRRLVESNDLEESIEFVGWVDDMPEFLNSVDIFVLPSLNEGIPGVVKEALATETPVIATNVGGVPEIVEHGVTGYLVESKSPSQIAEYILELYEYPQTREQIGVDGRQRIVDEYSVKRYIGQYKSILGNH